MKRMSGRSKCRPRERERSKERDWKLVVAGEKIQSLALNRKQCYEEKDDNEEGQSMDFTPKKQRNSTSALEHVSVCLVDTAERQRVMNESKLAVEEKRFEFEIKCAKKEDEQFERTQAVAERRQTLEERRFDLDKEECEERMRIDKEERKQAREIRKAMLSLIQKLMEK